MTIKKTQVIYIVNGNDENLADFRLSHLDVISIATETTFPFAVVYVVIKQLEIVKKVLLFHRPITIILIETALFIFIVLHKNSMFRAS